MKAIDSSLETKDNALKREQIIHLVRKWGDVNTDAILDPMCCIYSNEAIEGLIGYRLESHVAVVFGDPVCAPLDKPTLAMAFQKYCEERDINAVYTIASEEFAHWAIHNLFSSSIEFGEKFVLNPLKNPVQNKGSKAGLVRKKVKHALQEGTSVQEYIEGDSHKEKAIEELAANWQQARRGPQVYLAHMALFKDRSGKRWFYATQGQKIVGILTLNELKSHSGWLLNNVMVAKEAPHGSSELLVITTLQVLEKENCQFVTIGPVPRKELGKISGLGKVASALIRWVYYFAKKLFKLGGHEAFWEKFQPQVASSYLLFPHKSLSFTSIKAVLKALNVNL